MPFADVDDMNRTIVDNWNQAVAKDDTVWVIGDFALGKIAGTPPLVAEFTGHKDPHRWEPRPLLGRT